ncbi:sensor histidine kinase [Aliamphritea ceti]|uniref:sensor histidine kinase n=1 Tax=Aliamphritea ceti TaxID=1524258 RepID=UPI0021C354FF|nr:HAMP domain-containing histidine kinase [Aliamphritea ceti]
MLSIKSVSLNSFRRLKKMTALRQAVFLTLLFLTVLMTAGWFSAQWISRELDSGINDELKLRHETLARQLQEQQAAVGLLPNSSVIFASFIDAGKKTYGYQSDKLYRKAGLSNVELDIVHSHEKSRWRIYNAPAAGGQLVIAINLDHRYDVLERIGQSYLVVSIIVSLVTLMAGLLIGLYNQQRYNRISKTLDTIAAGDLSARINLNKARDDLDLVAQRIDLTTVRLESLVKQTQDLSANIAHDLKTPMARLRARIESALLSPEAEENAVTLEAALEQIDKMIATFEAILRIAYLNSGEYRASFQPLALNEIVLETADIYSPVVEDSGRKLRLDIKGQTDVMCSRELLIQLLANLIENAIRHTPEGSVIWLSCHERSLTIEDNGPGVPESERLRVLEPMYRLEKSRSTSGSGLGLSLVNTIAQLHQAKLVLADTTGNKSSHGLKVQLAFPVAERL